MDRAASDIDACIMSLTSLDGVTFSFQPGAVSLNFVHTGGRGAFAVFETLHTPGDLGAWLAGPPLRVALTRPIGPRGLERAKDLRETIWTGANALADGDPLPSAVITDLNAHARPPALAPQLVRAGAGTVWAPANDVRQPLSTLARDAIALFTSPMVRRIRRCEAANCYLVFVDTSRPGARRWCSMERCGNRHKQRQFRARSR